MAEKVIRQTTISGKESVASGTPHESPQADQESLRKCVGHRRHARKTSISRGKPIVNLSAFGHLSPRRRRHRQALLPHTVTNPRGEPPSTSPCVQNETSIGLLERQEYRKKGALDADHPLHVPCVNTDTVRILHYQTSLCRHSMDMCRATGACHSQ